MHALNQMSCTEEVISGTCSLPTQKTPLTFDLSVPFDPPPITIPTTSPLTPSLASIKGTESDISEAYSGDTVPSSIAEEANGLSRTLMPSKAKELELEGPTSTKHVSKGNEVKATASTTKDSNAITLPDPPKASRPTPVRLVTGPADTKPHAVMKNHTIAASSSDISRIGKGPERERHMARQLSSIRRPPMVGNGDSHDGSKHSTIEAEIHRMRHSLMKLSVQKRKEFMEDETVLIGNKISEGHQNFVMAYNMLTGIRVAVSRCSGVMRKLNDADFKATKKLSFDMDGTELTPSSRYDFKFKDYSPDIFRELRNLFGIDPADYLMSITGKYILSELGSPGKSGSFFYYSRDFRFIIKTIHHSEHKQLRRMLKEYYTHVKENPNTLISQFYGLHRIKVNGGMKKVYFIVMNNLFPPHRDIHIKYDLKGSTWGRYTRLPKDSDGPKDISAYTLKDLNWLEREDYIQFGPEKRKIFLKQLEADVKLLKRINVMDYSFLFGIHDVKRGNLAMVEKLSIFDPKSSLKAEVVKTNPRDIDRGLDLPTDVFPGRSKYIFYGHDGGIRATNEMNEPVTDIYYMGIIDCLTNYSMKKRLETAWRSLSHTRNTISALPAKEYGDRFLSFIRSGLSKKAAKTA